jgi:hypothetical protein
LPRSCLRPKSSPHVAAVQCSGAWLASATIFLIFAPNDKMVPFFVQLLLDFVELFHDGVVLVYGALLSYFLSFLEIQSNAVPCALHHIDGSQSN